MCLRDWFRRNRRTTPEPEASATPDAIRHRAYFLWEAAGYPAGRDVEFWLAAERDYRKETA
jgi:Protein of unknown function (DUF2934)